MPAGPAQVEPAQPSSADAAGRPFLLEFTAPGCGACRQMEGTIRELGQQYADDLRIYTVDVCASATDAIRYRVSYVPTQVYLDASGRELHRHVGVAGREEIVETWRRLGYALRPAGNVPAWPAYATPAPAGRGAYCTTEGCVGG